MARRADNLPVVAHRVLNAAILAAVVLVAAAPAAGQSGPDASARATGVRIVVPGAEGGSAAGVAAPPQAGATLDGWSYGDGAVSVGATSTDARTGRGSGSATANGSATVGSVSLFGGEITVDGVAVKASAGASGSGAQGSLADSSLSNLVVLGQSLQAASNQRVELADWGYAVLLEQAVVREDAARRGYRGFVSGLHVVLTKEHSGLPAGTEITIGYAEAAASAPRPAPAQPSPQPQPDPPGSGGGGGGGAGGGGGGGGSGSGSPPPPVSQQPRDPVPTPPGSNPTPPPVVKSPPPDVRPKLTDRGYVFPVYGQASFTDDFAAARATTGWHHGNDIFAPLGAPLLAVTDGTLFLVGWNDVGGNRLWLRDAAGNEFYYAHLSAFSPLAREGAQVKAGDVIGFVGTTGDAAGTPPHLHFEIHPRELLWMGYDGVVNPYPYLTAWLRLDDIAFGGWTPQPGSAPQPGAVLLQAEDISTLSGLGDDTLSSYLVMPELFGEGGPGPAILGADPGFG
jgi:murein DD-endopeptidase MepM/ murein hydrolase activator NlpD